MEEIKLTPKQQKFVDEYLICMNATQAALNAGYSEHTAAAIGGENLQKPIIQKAIALRSKKTQAAKIATMEQVHSFWYDTLLDPDVDLKHRLKASEYIAKTKAAFIDKVSHSGSVSVNNPLEGLSTEDLKKLLEK